MRKALFSKSIVVLAAVISGCFGVVSGQTSQDLGSENVRLMTIPVSIFTREELKKNRLEEFVPAGRLTVKENGEEQEILSVKSVSNQPIAIEILIQDDLSSEVNLNLGDIKDFIGHLPSGSRVMVGYIRGGGLQVRQGFTRDLKAAADAIRIVGSSAAVAPRSPYEDLRQALTHFDGLPAGRRSVLIVSDGLDTSSGTSASPSQNPELDRSISEAQKRGVAVYGIYSPATFTSGGNGQAISNGQGSLNRLCDETGGRAFFQGFSAPVSFVPFIKNLDRSLNRQFAITYLTTNMKSGYYKVLVESSNPEIRIDHPKGYFYRKVRD
ncbi:MAG: hypothetical protein R2684_06850 [Pyrinomonadaceae bacterium]